MEENASSGWCNTSSFELHALAEQYGTPYFLYDADVVRRRIEEVRDAFEGLVKVYFAVKANPNFALLQALRDTADGLDISSTGELEQACLAGYDPSQLSFAGPGKSAEEIRIAVDRGVGCISAESLREIESCAEAAKALGKRANVTLRVNPLLRNRAFGMKMGGRPVQFGIDEEKLDAACAALARNLDHVVFRGIHVYAGSQCFDPAGIVETVMDSLRIANVVERNLGIPCAIVNFGGGFGVSHTEDGRELDVRTVGRDLVAAIRQFQTRPGGSPSPLFELGRFLTADAGLYVCRVLSNKVSRGKSFVIVDGGLHHHLAAAGTFGAALRSNFILRNLTHPNAPPMRCTVAGPSCNPTDLLGVDIELATAQHGDLIGVLKSGSYGLTSSPVLFLGRTTAPELVRRDGRVVLGRRPHTITDFN